MHLIISTNNNAKKLVVLGEKSTRLKDTAKIKLNVKRRVIMWTINKTKTYLLYMKSPHPVITEKDPTVANINDNINVRP